MYVDYNRHAGIDSVQRGVLTCTKRCVNVFALSVTIVMPIDVQNSLLCPQCFSGRVEPSENRLRNPVFQLLHKGTRKAAEAQPGLRREELQPLRDQYTGAANQGKEKASNLFLLFLFF